MRIQVLEVEIQEFMLVLPFLLACGKAFAMSWRWWWISDLGDEIGG